MIPTELLSGANRGRRACGHDLDHVDFVQSPRYSMKEIELPPDVVEVMLHEAHFRLFVAICNVHRGTPILKMEPVFSNQAALGLLQCDCPAGVCGHWPYAPCRYACDSNIRTPLNLGTLSAIAGGFRRLVVTLSMMHGSFVEIAAGTCEVCHGAHSGIGAWQPTDISWCQSGYGEWRPNTSWCTWTKEQDPSLRPRPPEDCPMRFFKGTLVGDAISFAIHMCKASLSNITTNVDGLPVNLSKMVWLVSDAFIACTRLEQLLTNSRRVSMMADMISLPRTSGTAKALAILTMSEGTTSKQQEAGLVHMASLKRSWANAIELLVQESQWVQLLSTSDPEIPDRILGMLLASWCGLSGTRISLAQTKTDSALNVNAGIRMKLLPHITYAPPCRRRTKP